MPCVPYPEGRDLYTTAKNLGRANPPDQRIRTNSRQLTPQTKEIALIPRMSHVALSAPSCRPELEADMHQVRLRYGNPSYDTALTIKQSEYINISPHKHLVLNLQEESMADESVATPANYFIRWSYLAH